MSTLERRRASRIDFRNLPWVFALRLDSPHAGERPLRVEAKNICSVGMKFVSNHKISIFSQVEVSFFDSVSGKELARISGKVTRVEEVDIGQGEKTFGLALEFPESTPLRALLESAAPSHSQEE